VVHVDDLCIAISDLQLDAKIKHVLESSFDMTKENDPSSFLGMLVQRTPDGIKISQPGFITTVLDRHFSDNLKVVDTPAVTEAQA
jgi:hypothetical protein